MSPQVAGGVGSAGRWARATERLRRRWQSIATCGVSAQLAAVLLLPSPLGSAYLNLGNLTGGPRPPEVHTDPVPDALAPVRVLFKALSRCRSSLSEADRWQIAHAIHLESERHGFDPLFVQAMIEIESTCSPRARSPRGAVGLIQMKPSTARAIAEEAGVLWRGVETLTHPTHNVKIGLHYLRTLEERFGDLRVAMAAFNLGPSRVARMSRAVARRARYVRDVLARYDDLRESHGVTPASLS
jgi:hypothetical protein